ncbi:MAG TPA: DUF438 domain-containing protein [Spirochaetota bacterium]|nr:DUF438 domain-containing protein [Spirochaetota bacterium]
MSELIDNAKKKREILKDLIRRLHDGQAESEVRSQLQQLLGSIPYEDVVKAEQELINEGLPAEEVIKLCDVHTSVLKGSIDQSGTKDAPEGHPVHTFRQENIALNREAGALGALYEKAPAIGRDGAEGYINTMRGHFNALMDVDKHYRRKEYLLFPFLEKHGITGPPKVMWAKHDEARAMLKKALAALETALKNPENLQRLVDADLKPASGAVLDMIYKEEQILLPTSIDTLGEDEWYEVYRQSDEIGYCLYDPKTKWMPEKISAEAMTSAAVAKSGRIQLPSGSFTAQELTAMLNSLPVDITFVDADDTVRYFSQGPHRIFDRNRAILGRKVQLCHPPHSVNIVERIIRDFRIGAEDSAAFWIRMNKRFIHIEYFALRDEEGAYLGTMEVSQDLTEKRRLEGEQRLLNYK